MKKLMLLFGLSLLLAYGCSNDDDDHDYEYVSATIEVLPDSIEFKSGADSSYLSVFINTIYTHNLIKWSALSDQSWCTAVPQYSAGSRQVKVKVTQNTTTQERVAYITIHPLYTNVNLKVKVIQDAAID